MTKFDLERILSAPMDVIDPLVMISDVREFLTFSEANIEQQYQQELEKIHREATPDDFESGEKKHQEDSAEHRFKVSLPLRVRYGALVALATSVEWSAKFLVKRLRTPIGRKPDGCNQTVHELRSLVARTRVDGAETIRNFQRIVHVRNCIAHNAGLEEGYEYRKELESSIAELKGFALDRWHFLGQHVCIERGALGPYMDEMQELVIVLYKGCHDQDLLDWSKRER